MSNWSRGKDRCAHSKCGRWWITPVIGQYNHVAHYLLYDGGKLVDGRFRTQREAKAHADLLEQGERCAG